MRLLVNGCTRTVRDLAQRYPQRLGHLLAPATWNKESVWSTGLPWACDNGCYSGFDRDAFLRMLERCAGVPGLLWVTAPDRVADARTTLALYREWEPILRSSRVPVAFVLQDGQDALELPSADCYFVGGTTRFKLSAAAADLSCEARARGAMLHVGRVNTRRRLRTARSFGADTVDGTSMSRWGDVYLDAFCRHLEQLDTQADLFDAPLAP